MSYLEELWRISAGSTPLPELPEGEAVAFLTMVDALAETSADSCLERWELSDEPDPLPVVALAEAPERAALVAALSVSELVAVTSPQLSEMTIYVDPFPDASGHNRLYVRDEEYLPGLLWAAFPTIEDGAMWLAQTLRGEKSERPPMLDDEWELSLWSGAYVLESLLVEELPERWRRVRTGEPLGPSAVLEFDLEVEPSAPHWRRAAALWLLKQTVAGKGGSDVADLLETTTPIHAAFVAHLRELEAATKGNIPAFVSDIAASGGPLAEPASAWVGKGEAQDEEPQSEFVAAVHAAMLSAVKEMIAQELVEIEPPMVEAAVVRLVAAAENAANTKQLIAAVLRTLLDAPEVEEVYGSDTELRSVFIRQLGG